VVVVVAAAVTPAPLPPLGTIRSGVVSPATAASTSTTTAVVDAARVLLLLVLVVVVVAMVELRQVKEGTIYGNEKFSKIASFASEAPQRMKPHFGLPIFLHIYIFGIC
jgi:hypothetical protein